MWTLSGPHRAELEVKHSRFIAMVAPVSTPEAAMDVLARDAVADADHNAWAYKIGPTYRFSDDGEPGGTAGRPILAAIEGQGLDHVVAVVARYFGGIKLGSGGLVRAYGGAAALALREAPRLEIKPTTKLCVEVPFSRTGSIWPTLDAYDATRLEERWTDTGLLLRVEVRLERADALLRELTDATRGGLIIHPCP